MCLRSLSPSSHTVPRAAVTSLAERCVDDAPCQIFSSGYLARSPGSHERTLYRGDRIRLPCGLFSNCHMFYSHTISTSFSIFIGYFYLFILISQSQVTGLLYCVATAMCAFSFSEVFLIFFRLSKGIPFQGVLWQWRFFFLLYLGYTVPRSNVGLGTYHPE